MLAARDHLLAGDCNRVGSLSTQAVEPRTQRSDVVTAIVSHPFDLEFHFRGARDVREPWQLRVGEDLVNDETVAQRSITRNVAVRDRLQREPPAGCEPI